MRFLHVIVKVVLHNVAGSGEVGRSGRAVDVTSGPSPEELWSGNHTSVSVPPREKVAGFHPPVSLGYRLLWEAYTFPGLPTSEGQSGSISWPAGRPLKAQVQAVQSQAHTEEDLGGGWSPRASAGASDSQNQPK